MISEGRSQWTFWYKRLFAQNKSNWQLLKPAIILFVQYFNTLYTTVCNAAKCYQQTVNGLRDGEHHYPRTATLCEMKVIFLKKGFMTVEFITVT